MRLNRTSIVIISLLLALITLITSKMLTGSQIRVKALSSDMPGPFMLHSTNASKLKPTDTMLRPTSPERIALLMKKYTSEFRVTGMKGYVASRPDNSEFRVPNIVHFVRFGKKPISFVEAMCIKAAYVRQRPDLLIIHTDIKTNHIKVSKILSVFGYNIIWKRNR